MTARPGTVLVYTLPACPDCTRTTQYLAAHGIVHRIVRVDRDPAARDHLKQLGHRAAPVVVTPEGASWSGHRPEFLSALLPDADTDTTTDTGAAEQVDRAAGGRDVTAAGRRAVTAVG